MERTEGSYYYRTSERSRCGGFLFANYKGTRVTKQELSQPGIFMQGLLGRCRFLWAEQALEASWKENEDWHCQTLAQENEWFMFIPFSGGMERRR